MARTKNDFSNVMSKLNGSVWYITRESLDMLLSIVDNRLQGNVIDGDEVRLMLQREAGDHDRRYRNATVVGPVGVLPLYGPIFPKANMMTEHSGATSMESFRQDFRELMANDYVQTILMDVDSPGGMSDMIPEMAAEINAARQYKDIVAVANTGMNSAAYYLGSQASKLYATPSGQVGSIGTYLVHTDESKMLEKAGIKETYVSGGRFKTELIGPLSDDAKEHLQNYVDQHYNMFVDAVASGRGTTVSDVEENFGQGRVFTANDAFTAGMVDGIESFDNVLGRLIESGGAIQGIQPGATLTSSTTGYVPSSTTNVAPVAVVRSSYDADKEHSEPGTGQGGEPTPAPAPEKGDPAIVGGWRRDPPPIAYEIETQEAVVTREWLEERAEALSIVFSDDVSDEDLASAIADAMDEVVIPLTSATSDAQRQQDFARDYPEVAARMEQLVSRDRANEARGFAESYRSFASDPKHGYSTLVREKLASAHLALGERTFNQNDLKELVDSLSNTKSAIVPVGEEGSGRIDEETGAVIPSTDFREARKQFADLVSKAMTEHGLNQKTAIEHVAEQNPELAKAYAIGHVKGGN